MKMKMLQLGMLLMVLAAVLSGSARADGEWSTWRHVSGQAGGIVDVRTRKVGTDVWTWQFKNTSQDTTVTYMKFMFTDKDGPHDNEMTYSLPPAGIYGGESVYTASSDPNGDGPPSGVPGSGAADSWHTSFSAYELKKK